MDRPDTEPQPSPPPSPDAPRPEPDPTAEPPAPGPGRKLIVLIAHDGREPGPDLSDQAAQATWAAVSTPWHPALLARLAELPRIEGAEAPSPPEPGEVRLVVAGASPLLPPDYLNQAEEAGAVVLGCDPQADRLALIGQVLEHLEPGASPSPTTTLADEGPSDQQAQEIPSAEAVANDFLALGAAVWWLRDLTVGMNHLDTLDHANLSREVLAGARAWLAGDTPTAVNRLRASFELLTQARERFYPVDAYLVDLCLLDPSTPPEALRATLESRAPVSFLAPARAVAALAEADPACLAAIREAIGEGWADVVGGTFEETDEPLRPVESILWQFRHGGDRYRHHLDDRSVETLARRRFALYPLLPQLARRFGFRFALPMCFDGGKFPVRRESKRLWEGVDGTQLESLTRLPLAADRAADGARLAWKLAHSMKSDHVATVVLMHWPEPVAGWFRDLRRVAAYSPVLARWVTLNDYFHLTDRPFESFRPELDDYASPDLAQAVARADRQPISARVAHARLRARFDAVTYLHALDAVLTAAMQGPEAVTTAPNEGAEPNPLDLSATETALETGRLDEAGAALDRLESERRTRLAGQILGVGVASEPSRPGYLVLNPLGIPRRVPVLLPEAEPDLRPEGPLRASQFTEEGVWAVVELPAFGYAWVPRASLPEAAPAPQGVLAVADRTLRNESLEVEIDRETGGIRSLRAAGNGTARLGQQLVIAGLTGRDGKPATSQMRAEGFTVDYAGPALVQALSRGKLVDPQGHRLASFQQRFRLWSGRPVLDLEITLADLDPDGLARLAAPGVDPWSQFLSCRWAWPDPEAFLRRTSLLAALPTSADRPETPDALDISTRRQRAAVLFGGLAHHQRHGPRMLDTLLIAGQETARTFRLGVVLDLEHPFQAAQDFLAPAFVVPTDAGPPRPGPAGWFFHLDNKAVAITRVEFVEHSGDGRGWGVAFHVLETAGRAARCRLRTVCDPLWARQTDYLDGLIVDLPSDGDGVLIDLTPHEMARIDVTLG